MKDGYISLTYPYAMPEEEEEFRRAVAQLQKGGRDYLIYEADDTAEIFVRAPANIVPFDDQNHDTR